MECGAESSVGVDRRRPSVQAKRCVDKGRWEESRPGAEATLVPMTTANLDVGIIKSPNPWFCQLQVRSATLLQRSFQFRSAFLLIEFRTRYKRDVTSTTTKVGLIDENNRVLFNKAVLLNITQESVTFRLMCYSLCTREPLLHGYSSVTVETFLQSSAAKAKVLLVQSTFQGRGMSLSPPTCAPSIPSTSYSTPRTHLCVTRTAKSTSSLPPRAYQHRHFRVTSESDDDSTDDEYERNLRGRASHGEWYRDYVSEPEEFSSEDEDPGTSEAKKVDADYLSMTCPVKALPSVPKKRFSLFSIPRVFKAALRIQKSPKLNRSAEMPGEELSKWKGFEAVVNDEEGFQSLRSHMKDEKNEENLDFWKECQQLEDHWSEDVAQSVYARFVKMDAPQEVNLDCDIRKTLASSLTQESIRAARRQIGSLIERDPFPRFLKSQRFTKFLEEKISGVI
ncbi:hypothetical protein QR680_012657 [Steinernema hermaphroditum]|uniref:RGS domain-containing protein n=1 Tax=Steinernema hermaphroditum TaxID=289476 RepID=A0AA39M0V8_9BILA|nr:hypothetical protein QR680_012657 [Steinernema hermaphroditum]